MSNTQRLGFPDARREQTRIEAMLHAIPSADQPPTPAPQTMRFQFVEGFENHVTAYRTDGTNVGTTLYKIALPRGVRRQDQPAGYTYDDWQNRTRDSDSRDEGINVQFEADDEFDAKPVKGGTGVQVSGEELVFVIDSPALFWIHKC